MMRFHYIHLQYTCTYGYLDNSSITTTSTTTTTTTATATATATTTTTTTTNRDDDDDDDDDNNDKNIQHRFISLHLVDFWFLFRSGSL